MANRSVEEIEKQLKRVDEIIYSKESLLKDDPDDDILQIGLMQYEDLKEDLIRELADVKKNPRIYTNYIELRLKKTQEEIAEANYLEIVYPENSEIKDKIDYLKLNEEGLVKELQFCYLESGYSVYEVRLNGKTINDHKMPISQLGDLLVNFQSIPDSIYEILLFKEKNYITPFKEKATVQSSLDDEQVEYKEITKNGQFQQKGMLDDELVNNQLYTPGIISGSIRVLLMSAQPTVDNSHLTNSLRIFKEIVECGDNKEAIREQIKFLGDNKPIAKYQKFLYNLSKNEIDMEFSGKNKDLADFNIFQIDSSTAGKVYEVLNKKDEPLEKPIKKIGKFRAVDLEQKRFKFHIDDEEEVISGYFKRDLVSVMEDVNFTDTYNINLLSFIPMGEFKKSNRIQYQLLELT